MKSMKLIKILIATFFIIILLSQNIIAADIIPMGENWIDNGRQHTGTTMSTQSIIDTSNKVYSVLLGFGTAVAVIVGAILGIQYMMAGVSKKVEVKESLFPYLVSCAVLFGALGIWKLIVLLLSDV